MILLTTLILTSCSSWRTEPEVEIVTKIEKVYVPIQARPAPVNLTDVKIYVVTAENYDTFIQEFTEKNGELVYVAISIKDYENLSLNIADLRRYINQQKEIIVYYEENLSENISEETEK
tara:strand:- start:2332 stop:2688 length:357 start_codon:yes stop_codon:yes gene_type:complete